MNSIPYGRQNIDQEDIDAIVNTLTSDFLTQGPKVKEFEEKFAEYVEADYALAVSNATSGLHLAVLALDLKKGERVIQHLLLLRLPQIVCVMLEEKFGLQILIKTLTYFRWRVQGNS